MIDLKQMAAEQKYPRRLWTLVGYPETGKSVFATQMTPNILWIDADLRATEVVRLAHGDVYGLSHDPDDLTDARQIFKLVRANLRGMTDVRTIVVDTITAILEPIITETMGDIEAGEHKNKAAAWRPKAEAMSNIWNLGNFGRDMLWVYHMKKHLGGQGQWEEGTTVTDIEEARGLRNLNMQIELSVKNGVYAATAIWSRFGKYPVTVTDDEGMWANMPEKLEEAVYGEKVGDYTDWTEGEAPDTFPHPAAAIAWAMAQGAGFREEAHAKNAYAKVKEEAKASNAKEMRDAWVAEVLQRAGKSEKPAAGIYGYEVGGPNDPMVTADQLEEAPPEEEI